MEINLRPFKPSDAFDLASAANNPNIARYLTDQFPNPYSQEDAIRFISKFNSYNPLRVFAITNHNKVIGAIGIHPQEDIMRLNAELGYWIAEEYWGKGIITSAICKIVNYGFENFEINRIFARPFGSNIASGKALEKCGFHLEATIPLSIIKNGMIEDERIYAIRRK